MRESKATFIKQSAWMVAASLAGGVGMMLVHVVVGRKPEIYAQFKSLLSIFYIVGAAQGGLWILFARQAASALTPENQSQVIAATWRTSLWIVGVMFFAGLGLIGVGSNLANQLKLPSTAALWATWGLILATLFASLLRGLLQGCQNFTGLGLLSMVDGFGRLAAVMICVLWLGGGAASAISGALIGNIAAIFIGLWTLRKWLFQTFTPPVLGAVPKGFYSLFFSMIALQVLGQFDTIFLQLVIPSSWVAESGARYSTGSQIGFALTQFTVPVALVMFPKVVRGVAKKQVTNALQMTLVSTLGLGILAALACTVVPWLPVQILFSKIPTEISAPLVPWFAWSMLFYTLANVLLSDRLARADFRFMPWIVALALGYIATLLALKDYLLSGTPQAAFFLLVRILGGANFLLLALAIIFSLLGRTDPKTLAPPSIVPPGDQ